MEERGGKGGVMLHGGREGEECGGERREERGGCMRKRAG